MKKNNKILNINEIKEIFIKSNFFNWLEENEFKLFYNEDGEYDSTLKEYFFHSIKYNNRDTIDEISPMHFLHGRCCEFAIALARQFGYKVIINFDYDDEGNFLHLIHAYCLADDNGNTELIDVRGVQSKYNTDDLFVCEPEFEYDWDNNTEIILEVDEAIKFLSKNLKFDEFHYNNLDDANKIIELFKEKYSI